MFGAGPEAAVAPPKRSSGRAYVDGLGAGRGSLDKEERSKPLNTHQCLRLVSSVDLGLDSVNRSFHISQQRITHLCLVSRYRGLLHSFDTASIPFWSIF